MGALKHFRLPAISIDSSSNAITIHHSLEKSPSPLPLHHSPLLTTYAVLSPSAQVSASELLSSFSPLCLLDPSLDEEILCSSSKVSVSVNEHGEVCFVEQMGGELTSEHLQTILQAATNEHIPKLTRTLFQAMTEASLKADTEMKEKLLKMASFHYEQQQQQQHTASTSSEQSMNEEESKEEDLTRLAEELDASVLDYSVRHVPIALRTRKEEEGSSNQTKQNKKA